MLRARFVVHHLSLPALHSSRPILSALKLLQIHTLHGSRFGSTQKQKVRWKSAHTEESPFNPSGNYHSFSTTKKAKAEIQQKKQQIWKNLDEGEEAKKLGQSSISAIEEQVNAIKNRQAGSLQKKESKVKELENKLINEKKKKKESFQTLSTSERDLKELKKISALQEGKKVDPEQLIQERKDQLDHRTISKAGSKELGLSKDAFSNSVTSKSFKEKLNFSIKSQQEAQEKKYNKQDKLTGITERMKTHQEKSNHILSGNSITKNETEEIKSQSHQLLKEYKAIKQEPKEIRQQYKNHKPQKSRNQKLFGLFTVIMSCFALAYFGGCFNNFFEKRKFRDSFKLFEKEQNKKAYNLMKNANFHRSNPNSTAVSPRFSSLIQNSSWNLQSKFQNSQDMNNYQVIFYFYGEPGIGKSSAFAALISYLQNKNTRKEIVEIFPIFANFDNFIFIDGLDQSLTDGNFTKMMVDQFQEENYLVVLDDGHLVQNDPNKSSFIQQLNSKMKAYILLASTAFQQDKKLKNQIYSPAALVEPPRVQAVSQLHDALTKFNLGAGLPHFQREYFAYRMWYYCGGNFRKLWSIFDEYTWTYLSSFQNASQSIKEETTSLTSSQKKYTFFKKAYQYFEGIYGYELEEMADLEFGNSIGKERNFNILGENEDYQDLARANIVVKKVATIQKKQGLFEELKKNWIQSPKQETICFHSRRTQYAFARHFLDLSSHWIGRAEERKRYQYLLERILYNHILNFQAYLVEKDVNEERIRQLQNSKQLVEYQFQKGNTSVKLNSRLNEIHDELHKLEVKKAELEPLRELIKTENELTMLYYEAYQIQEAKRYTIKEVFTPPKIIEDLMKGPEHFQKKYHQQVQQGITKKKIKLETEIKALKQFIQAQEIKQTINEVELEKAQNQRDKKERQKTEIEETKASLAKQKENIEVMEKRTKLQKEVAMKFNQELKNMLEGNQQVGVIEEDILTKFNPELGEDTEVVISALRKAVTLNKVILLEAIKRGTELAKATKEKWKRYEEEEKKVKTERFIKKQ